jgi:hypothetical protein
MRRTATLSDDRRYRYRLGRHWGEGDLAVFLLLNPSTADAEHDDPTVRRCVGFAQREDCGGMEVINLFALRSTDPSLLRRHPDPEGPENSRHWLEVLSDPRVGVVIAAWGNEAIGMPESQALAGCARESWLCLGTTKKGQPFHPLYRSRDEQLRSWV